MLAGEKKKRVETTDRNNGIVIRCICGDEEKPSDDCEPEDENLRVFFSWTSSQNAPVSRLTFADVEHRD